MDNRQTKTKLTKSSLEFVLTATRLKKLTVEAHTPPEEAKKGRMELSYQVGISQLEDGGDSIIVHLMIAGKGLANDKGAEDDASFTIDAAIDGIYQLSRQPAEKELDGIEGKLANPLVPLLSDMIETLLTKCGYSGVVLAKNFPISKKNSKQN